MQTKRNDENTHLTRSSHDDSSANAKDSISAKRQAVSNVADAAPTQNATGQAEPSLSSRQIGAVFASLMTAMFIGSLDQTVVSTALPTIVGDLGGVDHMMWVTSAYLLASTVTMPLYGKLGDMIGRKHLFMLALSLFLIGSVICATGNSMAALIAGRAVQGLGGGGLIVLSQAIVADILPPKQRGTYLGFMGAAFGVSSVIGPLVGGIFTDYIGWEWCFWINVPLAVVALALAGRFLPAPTVTSLQPIKTFDARGAVAMSIAASCLVVALSWGGNLYEWASAPIVALFACCVAAAVVFVLIERRAENPLIPPKLFTNATFCRTTICGMLIMVGMMGITSYLPTYIQIVYNMGATASGYVMVPMLLGMMGASSASGVMASRITRVKLLPFTGCLFGAFGSGLLLSLTIDTSVLLLCGFLFLIGIGIGLGQQIVVLMAQNEFSIDIVGTATSANNFFREIGATVGSTIIGSLFTSSLMTNLNTCTVEGKSLASLGIVADSITPSLVGGLDTATQVVVREAYNDALIPIFGGLLVMFLVAALVIVRTRTTPLAATNAESGHPNDSAQTRGGETAA